MRRNQLLRDYKWESENEFSVLQTEISTIKQAQTLTIILSMIRRMPSAFLQELFDFVSYRFNGGQVHVVKTESIYPVNMTEMIEELMIKEGESP